ncbi:MAG TPA: isocitrate lyase, partial [Acidimicrobiaceae bacterium]|nr:isocitrate lyase [Acidimicrobiaceae bacterium]
MEKEWSEDPRWAGTRRDYTASDVVRLRGSYLPACSLARHGSEILWSQLHDMDYVHALGAMTGGQAIQYVKGGLPALYLSGWQVAGDANTAGHVYPDQSLYPVNSVPNLVERLNNALRRADQIEWYENDGEVLRDWLVPIVADGEAGFGGALNVYELMKRMLRAGAAGVHFED